MLSPIAQNTMTDFCHIYEDYTYLRCPESTSIEIPLFRLHFIEFSQTLSYEVNLASQCSHLEVLLLSKFWSDFSIDTDSGPLKLSSSYHLCVECFSQLSFDSEMYTKSAAVADFVYTILNQHSTQR